MDNLMSQWMQMIAEGGGINMDVKLIHSKVLTTDYTGTLLTVYNNEIKPYATFGQYNKICICMFENNTTTLSGKIDCVFFSLAVASESMTTNTRNGGMVRSGYTNIRSFDTSNDARCNAGTVLKIYEITL